MAKKLVKKDQDNKTVEQKVNSLIDSLSEIKSSLNEKDILILEKEIESRKKEILNAQKIEENKFIEFQHKWLLDNSKLLLSYFKEFKDHSQFNCDLCNERNVSGFSYYGNNKTEFEYWSTDLVEDTIICPLCFLHEMINAGYNPGFILTGLQIKYKDLNKV